MSEGEHVHPNYVRIWAILLVLLVISIIGPMLGIKWVMLITAFGIAVVKALMVCGYFMHLNTELRLIWYTLIATLALVGLFWIGTAPDVMKKEGRNWEKIDVPTHAAGPSAHIADSHGDHHEEGHDEDGDAHAEDHE